MISEIRAPLNCQGWQAQLRPRANAPPVPPGRNPSRSASSPRWMGPTAPRADDVVETPVATPRALPGQETAPRACIAGRRLQLGPPRPRSGFCTSRPILPTPKSRWLPALSCRSSPPRAVSGTGARSYARGASTTGISSPASARDGRGRARMAGRGAESRRQKACYPPASSLGRPSMRSWGCSLDPNRQPGGRDIL